MEEKQILKKIQKEYAKGCGLIRWIENFYEAPNDAYIVWEMNDSSVRLTHYVFDKDKTDVVWDFPIGSFKKDALNETLKKCREAMGNRRMLCVETPVWMHHTDDPDFDDYDLW